MSAKSDETCSQVPNANKVGVARTYQCTKARFAYITSNLSEECQARTRKVGHFETSASEFPNLRSIREKTSAMAVLFDTMQTAR